MTISLVVLGVIVAYTHTHSKGLLYLMFLKLQEKAENRSEFQKYLLLQEFKNDPEMIEAINNGSLLRYEDMELDPDIQKIKIERAQLLFLRNLCLSASVVLVII